jgi:hypothetical protein
MQVMHISLSSKHNLASNCLLTRFGGVCFYNGLEVIGSHSLHRKVPLAAAAITTLAKRSHSLRVGFSAEDNGKGEAASGKSVASLPTATARGGTHLRLEQEEISTTMWCDASALSPPNTPLEPSILTDPSTDKSFSEMRNAEKIETRL